MRRSARHLGMLALAMGVAASPLLGADAPQKPDPSQPPGLMSASGSGTVIMDGEATVIGLVRSPALIVVQDRAVDPAGQVRLRVGGRLIAPVRAVPNPPFLTTRRFRLPRGQRRFLLTGADMRVRIDAPEMFLSISGRLKVRLRGTGQYALNGEAPQAWDPGVPVTLGVISAYSRPSRGSASSTPAILN